MIHHGKTPWAFTLVELVIYVGLSTFILTMTTSSVLLMTRARTKDAAIQEVEAQGLEALLVITTTLKNAQTVTAPTLSSTASSLSVTTVNPTSTTSPMVFSLSGGVLNEQDGSSAIVPLTSSHVVVSNLTFTNYGDAATYGSVRVQFTVTASSTSGTSYTQTFYGTGTPRHISQ